VHGEVYEVNEFVYKKVVEIETNYEIKTVQTTNGQEVDAFFYKDNEAKKNTKRITSFEAPKYCTLWLQKTSKKSSYYQNWLSFGGNPNR
jgi:hypothetical protein